MNYCLLRKRLIEWINFFWKFIGGRSQFSNLKNVFQILLIISHGQALVERGFSTNKQLVDHNMIGETLFAQRIIEDHMRIHNLQPQQLQMTHKLMEYVKGARNPDQRKRSLCKIQNEKVQKEKNQRGDRNFLPANKAS